MAAALVASCGRPPEPRPAPAPVVVSAPEPEPEPEAAVEEEAVVARGPGLEGRLDDSFGRGGVVRVARGPGEHRFSGIVALDDDSMVVVGYARFADGSDMAAARVTKDGALDESFGDHGFLRIGKYRGFGEGVARDAKGRLLAVGYFYAKGVNGLVARFDRHGVLDPSFGRSGLVVVDAGSDDRLNRVWVRKDGTIIAVGHHSSDKNMAVALRSDGSLEPSFGQGGIGVVASPGGTAYVTRAVPAPDGGVIAAGYLTAEHQGLVIRLDANGKPDASFGRDGVAVVERPRVGSAWAVGVDAEGRVLLGVNTDVGPAAVFRLRKDGSMDTSFGKNGYALSTRDGMDQFYDLLADPAGRIVGVGFRGLAEDATALWARFTPEGELDPAFGKGGIVSRPLGGGTFLFDADWDSQGRLVACGNVLQGSGSPGIVARFR
ncbi:MAG: hypothetical protein H6717_39180 [Polyangiaceae bacterium]|nr:hypothetical protein [Polyangiaceae bacterium]